MFPSSVTPLRRHRWSALVREALNDLYRYEIRRLRRRLLAGDFPKADYSDHVIALRKQYWLLSIPVERWSRQVG